MMIFYDQVSDMLKDEQSIASLIMRWDQPVN